MEKYFYLSQRRILNWFEKSYPRSSLLIFSKKLETPEGFQRSVSKCVANSAIAWQWSWAHYGIADVGVI